MKDEVEILRNKVQQLIEDNMELHSRLEMNDYNPDKPVRKLTLQDKLELNMGEELKKYRIPTKDIKAMYYTIVKADQEPDSVDVSFDSQRYLTAFFVVDKEKEEKEIEKGENVGLDLTKIPDSMPEVQHHYEIMDVINRLTDISTNTGKVNHNDTISIDKGREG